MLKSEPLITPSGCVIKVLRCPSSTSFVSEYAFGRKTTERPNAVIMKNIDLMLRGEQNYLIILSPIIEKIPHY